MAKRRQHVLNTPSKSQMPTMNKWCILLEPEHISTGGEIGVEGTLDFILQELRNINGRFDNLEEGQAVLCERVGDIDSELKAFRIETRTSLQVIQTGQQSVQEEMTQRFKETKNSLRACWIKTDNGVLAFLA